MNHEFTRPELLEEALTHTSFAYENGGQHNERLEFLGDSVLQLCTTHVLYERFSVDREGVLSRYRARLVSTEHLATLARSWGLDKRVRLGKGEEQSGGRSKERLLAGVFEAVLGAIYLDAGHEAAHRAVEAALLPDLDALPLIADARQSLHEWCQRTHSAPPVYTISAEDGPAHDRRFEVEVCCGNTVLGVGGGKSKRTASIAAAEDAMLRMQSR